MTKQSGQSNEPAKHSVSSSEEQQAVNLVSAWIAKTKRATPDIRALDRWPNIDGYIEVTDEDGFPRGKFEVQVKKLSDDHIKNKRYSFPDNHFLSYCRGLASWIPILLIGVDLENEQAFWIHIDRDFLNKNGSSKTVKFVESQIIKSGENDFIEDWSNIVESYRSMPEELEQYKKAFATLSNATTLTPIRTDERFVSIHRFLDEINDYLDYKFPIVKQILYPNIWKLGLAYYRYGSTELAYTLYPIARNKNDVQIKEVDFRLLGKIEKEGLEFTAHLSQNPLKTEPKEYAKKLVHRKTSGVIDGKLLRHTGNEFLAKEYVFTFIDKYRTQMGLEQKDKYSLEEIEMAFHTYLPFWLKFSADLSSFPPNRALGMYSFSQITGLDNDKRNEVARRVRKALRSNEPVPIIPIPDERNSLRLSFDLFIEFFYFLKQTETKGKEIRRPYKEKDFSILKDGTADWVWNLFSKKDTDQNLKVFFKHLLEVYDAILKNNFPALRDELPLFGEADTILISWDLRDRYDHNGPTYYMYYLKSKTARKRVQIKLITEEDIKRYELEYPSSRGTIRFENEEYQLLISEYGVLDFIYDHTPMLSFIYKKLKERIDEYFKKTEPGPKFDKHSEADEAE